MTSPCRSRCIWFSMADIRCDWTGYFSDRMTLSRNRSRPISMTRGRSYFGSLSSYRARKQVSLRFKRHGERETRRYQVIEDFLNHIHGRCVIIPNPFHSFQEYSAFVCTTLFCRCAAKCRDNDLLRCLLQVCWNNVFDAVIQFFSILPQRQVICRSIKYFIR